MAIRKICPVPLGVGGRRHRGSNGAVNRGVLCLVDGDREDRLTEA
jgi:hypothetical protein